MSETAIYFENLTKIFPGVKALDKVTFKIRKGEIHALLGENGAGKSTLLNILHGIYNADEGKVYIENENVCFTSATMALNYGIAKVHQEINLVAPLNVGQNIALGYEPIKGLIVDSRKMYKQTDEILKKLGCTFNSTDSINELSIGEMQMITIAKALYHKAKIISFDEPTASLSNKDIKRLFEIIIGLKKRGITIIYVSHKLDEIYEIAERASILRDGIYVCTYDIPRTKRNELIRKMVGRDVSNFAVRQKPSCIQSEVVLEVKNLSGKEFSNISFNLYKGEILGFAGLVGSKRTDIMRAIFGIDKLDTGLIYINGKKVNMNSPEQALNHGLGLLPEDRKTQGFIKNTSNADNVALASIRQFSGGIIVNHNLKRKNFINYSNLLNIMPKDPDFLTENLSGGNQQKIILAKWLSTKVDILIFDEPTKGIDVGAKAEIYSLMEDLIHQGKSIIIISSELTEIIGMSDRIIVIHNGKQKAELKHEDFSEERILGYAMGEQ